MTSTFSFGFSGDDIDVDVDVDEQNEHGIENGSENELRRDSSLPELVEAERHLLHEWTPTLPSQISYNTLKLNLNVSSHLVNGASSTPSESTRSLRLGRREVFDIRAQLMAEDDDDHEELIAGLEEGDIKPRFYEGGFKTWECALDLAKLMASGEEVAALRLDSDVGDDDGEDVHVIELGCGTAMPSLAIFAQLLARPTPTSPPRRKFHFTLADYNATVLRLVTLPNLLLTWKLNTRHSSAGNPQQEADANRQTEKEEKEDDEGELDIDPALLDAFQDDLARRGILIDFVAGAWSLHFVDLALTSRNHSSSKGQVHSQSGPSAGNSSSSRPCRTLLLASETIYSPSSLTAFSETVLGLLRRSAVPDSIARNSNSSSSKALIAAKKVYFGVGGGIDEFLHVLHQQPLRENETVDVRQRVEVKTEGVGRVILQVEIQDRAAQEAAS
ncbi:hypothetical protein VTN77DRAFT_4924 [Rasamsonia byssochlamydoides]|uniref:uncharacterized protein n=1 Tax=Rasamsonia byssochlamydoides TaxID=89139 RepID=UPI0037448B69